MICEATIDGDDREKLRKNVKNDLDFHACFKALSILTSSFLGFAVLLAATGSKGNLCPELSSFGSGDVKNLPFGFVLLPDLKEDRILGLNQTIGVDGAKKNLVWPFAVSAWMGFVTLLFFMAIVAIVWVGMFCCKKWCCLKNSNRVAPHRPRDRVQTSSLKRWFQELWFVTFNYILSNIECYESLALLIPPFLVHAHIIRTHNVTSTCILVANSIFSSLSFLLAIDRKKSRTQLIITLNKYEIRVKDLEKDEIYAKLKK